MEFALAHALKHCQFRWADLRSKGWDESNIQTDKKIAMPLIYLECVYKRNRWPPQSRTTLPTMFVRRILKCW